MNLIEKINLDLVESIKTKKEIETSVLRLLKSALKNKEISLRHTSEDLNRTLSEEEVICVIQKEIKQRLDSIGEYQKAERNDLIKRERSEKNILTKYLPEQLSKEEIEQVVKQTINQLNASNISDMGKVIGIVISKLKGKAPGNTISEIVKKHLQG